MKFFELYEKNKIFKVCLHSVLIATVLYIFTLLVIGIMTPIKFETEKMARKEAVVNRLKLIRDVQRLYKSENKKFTGSFDTLVMFANTGKITIDKQIGSKDDSLAIAKTNTFKKKNRRAITEQDALENGLIWSGKIKVNVKDSPEFKNVNFDSIAYIPNVKGAKFEMGAKILKTNSGVEVSIFEAKVHNNVYLKGLDPQLIINLDDQDDKMNKYPGLSVGSLVAANNEAGNWE